MWKTNMAFKAAFIPFFFIVAAFADIFRLNAAFSDKHAVMGISQIVFKKLVSTRLAIRMKPPFERISHWIQ